MFREKFLKGKPELILIYTREKIHAVVRNSREILSRGMFDLSDPPEDVYKWGKKQKAASVKIVEPEDVHELKVELSEDAELEENINAINFEATSLSGLAPQNIRPAILMENSIEGFNHGQITSVFTIKHMKSIAQLCSHSGLKFQGFGSLQQALMKYHFSHPEYKDEILLLFMKDSAFAVIPDGGSITIRNMPFGLPGANMPLEQWEVRARRRLSNMAGRKVRLYLDEGHEEAKAVIAKILNSESLSENLLNNILSELSAVVCSGEINALKGYCLAGIPPREKDPREVGTMICLILIGGVTVFSAFQYTRLKILEHSLDAALANNTTIQGTIKSYESQLEKSKAEQKRLRYLNELINSRERIDHEFMLILNLLARYKLKYTKINEVCQTKNGIIFSGNTFWQPDLSKFFAHFESQLAKRKLTLISEELKKGNDNQLSFKCRIGKR